MIFCIDVFMSVCVSMCTMPVGMHLCVLYTHVYVQIFYIV